MIQEPDLHHSRQQPTSTLNPQQFAISEFLWLTAGAAVVLAIVVRIASFLSVQSRICFSILIALQMVANALLIAYLGRRRKRLLDQAGAFIGVGSINEKPSYQRPMLGAYIAVLLVGLTQIGASFWIALQFSLWRDGRAFGGTLFAVGLETLVISFIPTVGCIRFLRWRLRSEAVEFYEHGMNVFDSLTSWDRLTIRRCQSQGKIAVVHTAKNKNLGQDTMYLWIDESLIEQLIARADRTSVQ
jgi:hypothetical protein